MRCRCAVPRCGPVRLGARRSPGALPPSPAPPPDVAERPFRDVVNGRSAVAGAAGAEPRGDRGRVSGPGGAALALPSPCGRALAPSGAGVRSAARGALPAAAFSPGRRRQGAAQCPGSAAGRRPQIRVRLRARRREGAVFPQTGGKGSPEGAGGGGGRRDPGSEPGNRRRCCSAELKLRKAVRQGWVPVCALSEVGYLCNRLSVRVRNGTGDF